VASDILGVCPNTLKTYCREYGIKRWPYRDNQRNNKKIITQNRDNQRNNKKITTQNNTISLNFPEDPLPKL